MRRPRASGFRSAELGSHCRGSVFLDGGRLATPALEAGIDRISQAHPGFVFGRFDIRADSVESCRSPPIHDRRTIAATPGRKLE